MVFFAVVWVFFMVVLVFFTDVMVFFVVVHEEGVEGAGRHGRARAGFCGSMGIFYGCVGIFYRCNGILWLCMKSRALI